MAIFYPYYCLRAAFSSPLNEDLYHKRWALNSADPAIDYFQNRLKKSSKFSFEEQIKGFEIYVYVEVQQFVLIWWTIFLGLIEEESLIFYKFRVKSL